METLSCGINVAEQSEKSCFNFSYLYISMSVKHSEILIYWIFIPKYCLFVRLVQITAFYIASVKYSLLQHHNIPPQVLRAEWWKLQ